MQTDTLSNLYYSFDARSEYPYIMCTKKYPIGKFELQDDFPSHEDFDAYINSGQACLFILHCIGIKVIHNVTVPYISFSNCRDIEGQVLDNGRVLEARFLSITITEIDYSIIKEQYQIDEYAVENLYTAPYDYLPAPIRNHILDGFFEKCGYEERDEKESVYYGKCKNELNGNFGMMYTDPVRDSVVVNFDDTENRWSTSQADIEESLEKFFRSRNNFLCYQWGVWTTAHARRHHQNLINAFGEEFVYGDTDSAKGTDVDGYVAERISTLNDLIVESCIKNRAYYIRKDTGEILYMGIFVEEKRMSEFKTLGAKKYAYITADDNELHVTISGVQKQNSKGITSAQELGTIDNFDCGFIFSETGGLEMRYHDLSERYELEIKDDTGKVHKFTNGSNISSVPSTYQLNVGRDYENLLRYL